MRDAKELLHETRDRVAPPPDVLGSLERRRHRREQVRRGTAAAVAVVVALVGLGGWFVVGRDGAKLPADDLSRSELGIFADVRGWIAYGDPRSREPGIWAVDPADPEAEPILLHPDGGVPIAWSGDGSKLLVLRFHDWGSPSNSMSLVVLNPDGTETQLAQRDAITGGSFSPDGSEVVYGATLPGEGWKSGIYVVDADGGAPRLLYVAGRRPQPDAFQMEVSYPALSADGSRIAYFEGMGDWGTSLWVMNVDGTDRQQIVGEDVMEEEGISAHVGGIQWSPDGTRLALRGPGSIHVVNADGSELALVAAGVADVGPGAGPYWSPDGSRVAFTTGRERAPSLATVRPDGTELQATGLGRAGPWNPLDPVPPDDPTPDPAPSDDLGVFAPVAGWIVYGDRDGIWGVDPAAPGAPETRVQLSDTGIPLGWSSDGTRLLIMREFDDGDRWFHLFVMHADGSETQVTQRPMGWITGATISPDGSRVVFATYGAMYSVDVGGGPVEVLLEGSRVQAPTFSPDGARIAYIVGAGDHSHRVWVMDADGSDAHKILANETTMGAGHVYGLAWSPAGDRIAFGNDVATYTFATDGSGFTQVITDGNRPYWSPDGSQFAFIIHGPGDGGRLAIANADGSNVRDLGFRTSSGPWTSGPWHPAPRAAA